MASAVQISLLVYGILVLVGGVIGFVKAKSKVSLIAGGLSGLALICAYMYSTQNPKDGLLIGAGITSLLTIVFAMRLAKTKKLMPSGMLLILTVLEEFLLLVAAFYKL